MKTLASYLAGDWHLGAGPAITLVNPATEEPLAEVHGRGLALGGAIDHARSVGRAALAALTFAERGAILANLAKIVHGAREELLTLAVAAGCQGPHAIAQFAQSLNHGQRRRLGCRPTPGARHQFDVPCERTFQRLLEAIDSDQLRQAYSDWMATLDAKAVKVLHLDGKVLRNADPAPPRLAQDPALVEAAAALDTPADQQKPKAEKALTLVNFQTPDQRLIDQIAVPRDTNEEAAVAAHLPKMDLTGVLVIADAAHTTKANCRHLTQEQGANYLCFLKGNQPHAYAKAQQLLSGDFPPSGSIQR